jgi:hypothetical protein
MPALLGRSVLLVLLLLTTVQTSRADVSTDCDSDGLSDLIYVVSDTAGKNLYCAKSSTPDVAPEKVAVVGASGDTIALGSWLAPGAFNIGYIQSRSTGLIWKVVTATDPVLEYSQVEFGKRGNVIVLGGDFNGDGIGDGALVEYDKPELNWRVWHNPLAVKPGKKRKVISFGQSNTDRVFFMNPDGKRDRLAVMGERKGRATLILKDVVTGKSSRAYTGFPKFLIGGDRPRPFALQTGDGEDVIAALYEDETDTRLYVFNYKGQRIRVKGFVGLFDLSVGDYDEAQPGEEVALTSRTTNTVIIYNPFTNATPSTETKVAGAPTDAIFVGIVPQ